MSPVLYEIGFLPSPNLLIRNGTRVFGIGLDLSLDVGLAPALLCLSLICTTHYKSSSVDDLLVKFFIADTVCALISGVCIGFTTARQWWLRLLIALPVAAGLWLINALVGLFAGCALTTPGR